jgi:hypothetical protein
MNWMIETIAGAYLLPKSSGVITVIIYMRSVHFFVGFNWWNVCASRHNAELPVPNLCSRE